MEKNKWYIQTLTYPELINRNADQFGDKTAQWWRDNKNEYKLTYKELGENVKNVSCGLMEIGFQKGDRAAIMGCTSPRWALADYSVMCAGGVSVSVYPSLSENELLYILNDSGSKIIFIDDFKNFEKIRSIRDKAVALEKVIFLNEKKASIDSATTDIFHILNNGKKYSIENKGSYEKRWKSVKPEDKMMIVYTSGTTGKPKGVVHTHKSFNSACIRDLSVIPILKNDVFLSFLPLAHTYEKQCGHGVAMNSASAIAYSSPVNMVDDLKFFSPTIFMSVPRIYERIFMQMKEKSSSSFVKKIILKSAFKTAIDAINSIKDQNGFLDMDEGRDINLRLNGILKLKYKFFDKLVFSKVRELLGGRLRFAFSASGSLSKDLCEAFLSMGIRIYEGYGSTETMNTVNLNRPDKILTGSVGCPSPGVKSKIAEDGEWLVKGDNLFLEYWNKPDLTKEAFTEDGFYKTGDIVEILDDGYIKIKDRKKGLIVLDTGKNVPSSKIESLFATRKYIDTVVPFGTDKKFISAVIIPDFDMIIKKMESEGRDIEKSDFKYEDGVCVTTDLYFTEKSYFKKIIDREIEYVNKKLEDYEKIKKYIVSNSRLTEKSGELTPTLKVKRDIVYNNFNDKLEKLYY